MDIVPSLWRDEASLARWRSNEHPVVCNNVSH
jgi:hypothetical protein